MAKTKPLGPGYYARSRIDYGVTEDGKLKTITFAEGDAVVDLPEAVLEALVKAGAVDPPAPPPAPLAPPLEPKP